MKSKAEDECGGSVQMVVVTTAAFHNAVSAVCLLSVFGPSTFTV